MITITTKYTMLKLGTTEDLVLEIAKSTSNRDILDMIVAKYSGSDGRTEKQTEIFKAALKNSSGINVEVLQVVESFERNSSQEIHDLISDGLRKALRRRENTRFYE